MRDGGVVNATGVTFSDTATDADIDILVYAGGTLNLIGATVTAQQVSYDDGSSGAVTASSSPPMSSFPWNMRPRTCFWSPSS